MWISLNLHISGNKISLSKMWMSRKSWQHQLLFSASSSSLPSNTNKYKSLGLGLKVKTRFFNLVLIDKYTLKRKFCESTPKDVEHGNKGEGSYGFNS